MLPAPGVTPVGASGWLKIADSRAAKRMSHASTNSLPAAPHATLDLRDGDKAACAEMAKHQANRRLAGQFCRLCPVLLDLGHVDMGNKIVGVGALEHERPDGVIGLGSLNQGNKIADQ
jgi:hypothetical protein